MKKLILLALALSPLFIKAQTFKSLREAEEATKDGLKTSSGWIIKQGDKIKMGRGTMPDKDFAFIYESRTLSLLNDYNAKKSYLASSYASKEATVKKINFVGTKKTGFTPQVVVGLGLLSNYWIEIENAIEAGEVIPPAEFAKKAEITTSAPVSVADELKKLKDLLDSGAITQEEYDAQKKKLLN